MRLRSRFEDVLKERVAEFLPDALETVWETIGVTAAIEVIKFTPEGGVWTDKAAIDWELLTSFEGILRVELRSDNIDQLIVEPLTANLVDCPAFIHADAKVEANAISEKARGVLIEMRDTVRDSQIVSQLRFEVTGNIMKRLSDADAPELLIGKHPNVGADHEGDYTPIDEIMTAQEIVP